MRLTALTWWTRTGGQKLASMTDPMKDTPMTRSCRGSLFLLVLASAVGAADKPSTTVLALKGVRVTLDAPVLVGRNTGFLWFPTLAKLADGRLLAQMSNYKDDHVKESTCFFSWSSDQGRTWSPLVAGLYGDANVRLSNGDQLLLPYYLKPLAGGGLGAPYQLQQKGKREVRVVAEGVSVTGLPKPDRSFAPQLGLAGFVFNGSTVELKGGGYLATLYGYFQDAKRYNLVAVVSDDGIHWKFRSIVADDKCPLPGADGPSEQATCRLKDGRLMCVFRMEANKPYGRVFSSDEGKTWTEPVSMGADLFSVQPGLAVMPDGTVVLSGGRPGIYAWINLAGDGQTWQRVELHGHHDRCHPQEKIEGGKFTSAYTEIVALDAKSLLVIYDRIPRPWKEIPKGSADTNSVWVVKMTLDRDKSAANDR
jgi:hypothetical protein